MQENINKQIVELHPITTIRDKKGFRFYSTDDGNTLYAEKNGKIYNVSSDSLNVLSEVFFFKGKEKEFAGLINDEDIKDLHPLHYEYTAMDRTRKKFSMAKGGEIEIGDYVKIKETYGGGSGTVEDIVNNFVVVKTKEGKKSYHVSDLIAYSSASEAAYDEGDEGNEDYEDYEDGYAQGGTIKEGSKIKYLGKEGKIITKKKDMYFVEIENYYPNGDTSYTVLREGEFEKYAHGGELESKKQNLLEFLNFFPNDAKSWGQATDELRDIARMARITYLEVDDKEFEPLDFKTLKTPSEWNTKGKLYIFDMYLRMSDEAKKEFLDAFEQTFDTKMAHGGSLDNFNQETIEEILDKANGDREAEYDFTFDVLKENKVNDIDKIKSLAKFARGANYHSIADACEDIINNKVDFKMAHGGKTHDSKILFTINDEKIDDLLRNSNLDYEFMDDDGYLMSFSDYEKFKVMVSDKGYDENKIFVSEYDYANGGEIPTITKEEWSKIPKFNKHIGMDGIYYLMKYDDKIGTYLQPVKVLKNKEHMAGGGEVTLKDAKYTMGLAFDNAGFAKAFKDLKKLSNDTFLLQVSSYIKDNETLQNIVNEFNETLKSNFIINSDSFKKTFNGNEVKIENKTSMAYGGMIPGRYYKDNKGEEYRFVGESRGKLLFKDGEKVIEKSENDFEDDYPKESKLFGFFENGGKVKRTVKLTLLRKDSDEYTYKQDGTTGTAAEITFSYGKKPFQYEVKKISKSLEPLKQDILEAFTIQGIKQHEYKGGFSEAIKHLDTKVVYENKMAKGGETDEDEEYFFQTKRDLKGLYNRMEKEEEDRKIIEEKWNKMSKEEKENFFKKNKQNYIDFDVLPSYDNIDSTFSKSFSELPNGVKDFLEFNLNKDSMAKGGEVNEEEIIDKLEEQFRGKDLWEDEILDEYEVKMFDFEEFNDEEVFNKWKNKNSKKNYIVPFESDDDSYIFILVPKNKMEEGGEVSKAGELKSKIEKILDKVLPGFYKNVFVRKNYFDKGESIGIIMAASNYEINRVKGQYPQDVSLMLDVEEMDLNVQVFGGNGGNRIYLVPDKNDPKEKYLAMAGVKIPFRTPKKEEKFVLQAIEKFAENYKKALKENKDRLMYKEYVDYDTLIMAKGGMTEHGLKIGDKIIDNVFWNNQIVVENTKTNKKAVIDLETGKRKDSMSNGGETELVQDPKTKEFTRRMKMKPEDIETVKKIQNMMAKEKSNFQAKNKMAEGGEIKVKETYKYVGNESLFAPLRNGRNTTSLKKGDVVKVTRIGVDNKEDSIVVNFDGDAILVNKNKLLNKDLFEKTMSKGGEATFEDKVKAVQKNLLKKKKVPAAVQKDYGKTYNKEEAKESAQRIIGSQTAKWRQKNSMAKGGKTSVSPLKDRIFGSKKNKTGTASSKTSAKDIELNDSIVEALSEKAKKYNDKHSNKVSVSTLKAVMRRGMGAFSSSHRPGMTRQGWGYARVNKFLQKKGGAKVKAAYVQDDDLL